mmetsp:Transcript_15674/g.31617  ORF Transcript_15674/g.31617 Transcript_15674/m.31617 type:complete len:127 (-) Transcript_15674:137-517(-)
MQVSPSPCSIVFIEERQSALWAELFKMWVTPFRVEGIDLMDNSCAVVKRISKTQEMLPVPPPFIDHRNLEMYQRQFTKLTRPATGVLAMASNLSGREPIAEPKRPGLDIFGTRKESFEHVPRFSKS